MRRTLIEGELVHLLLRYNGTRECPRSVHTYMISVSTHSARMLGGTMLSSTRATECDWLRVGYYPLHRGRIAHDFVVDHSGATRHGHHSVTGARGTYRRRATRALHQSSGSSVTSSSVARGVMHAHAAHRRRGVRTGDSNVAPDPFYGGVTRMYMGRAGRWPMGDGGRWRMKDDEKGFRYASAVSKNSNRLHSADIVRVTVHTLYRKSVLNAPLLSQKQSVPLAGKVEHLKRYPRPNENEG
ncbi:hypothetical protein C8Q78DRAFT_244835 [Trametes maxima]|nr:hypothetical protein C8Q78DRAFT_244835 [Trametes maxima]